MSVSTLSPARPATNRSPKLPSRPSGGPRSGLNPGEPRATAGPRQGTDVQAAAGGGIGGLRFGGHWFELLSDLGMLGRVRLDLATARVSFADRLDIAALRVNGSLGTLTGVEQSLRLLLDRCYALATSTARDGLWVEDDLRRPQLCLRPLTPDGDWLWRLVLDGVCGASGRIVPRRESAPAPVLGPLQRHPLAALQDACDQADAAPGFRDTAELTGQLELQPARMRREAGAGAETDTAVDPALIPCALRNLCEEVLPLVVTVGSDALVLRRQVAFYAYDYSQGRAQLQGAETRLEIDAAAIDSAWVVGSGRHGGSGRQLRLYDADGRALAIIGAAPRSYRGGSDGVSESCGCPEPRFWRSLMNALVS